MDDANSQNRLNVPNSVTLLHTIRESDVVFNWFELEYCESRVLGIIGLEFGISCLSSRCARV